MSSLLLVGCGNMGSALLQRWQDTVSISRFDVIDPKHEQQNTARIFWHKNLESLPKEQAIDIVVFAVKPQHLIELLPSYKHRFSDHKLNPLYLSIAAGKGTDFFREQLGKKIQIVRAMPNTPAVIGRGITVLYGASGLSESSKYIATSLMQAIGKVEWIKDEALMDAVTGISGSGPAYIFLFLDALTKAGVNAGLPEALARSLALETLSGSGALARHMPDSFEQLRKNVTSPGGTTEAALKILMGHNVFEALINKAVESAVKRSRELK